MTYFLKEIDSTHTLCSALITQHMTFVVKTTQLILAPTTATLCYWRRMMALNLLLSILFAMLMSWAYTIQMSSSPGQNLGTINQDVLNSFGSDGSSFWKVLLMQVSRSALLIKEDLYRRTWQMHLLSLTLLMCFGAVILYHRLQMVSNAWMALQPLGIVEMQMIGSTITSTGMCLCK